MKPLILVFPGQASQYVGMGKDIYEKSLAARDMMDQTVARPELAHLRELIFDGPAELLTRTDNVQPAITLVSLMVFAGWQEAAKSAGVPAEFIACAGHSLGEYAAHAAAGNLSPELAIELTRQRGYWMNHSSQPPNPVGGMVALMGLSLDAVKQIAESIGSDRISLANVNSPGQFILSGEATAITEAIAAAETAGAKRIIPLNVSGAWHSSLMRPAQEKMGAILEQEITDTKIQLNGEVKVLANATGAVVESVTTLRETLTRQITSPVIWTEAIRNLLIATGYPGLPSELSPEQIEAYHPWPIFVEVGPGKVLRGLIRSIDKGLETAGIEDAAGIEAFIGTMR